MSTYSMIAASGVSAHTRLNPIQLFLDADIVVQLVMVGLLLASVWTWMIIVSFSLRLARISRRNAAFEAEFLDSADPAALAAKKTNRSCISARVANEGLAELQLSTAKPGYDADGVRQRIATAMDGRIAAESDALAERLNFLATTGAVAPFVGLFGTVWGIMNSFIGISEAQTTNLAVVAPGIAEALLATAIGLVAAIPAVVIYNVFSRSITGYRQALADAAAGVERLVSRDLDFRKAPAAARERLAAE